LEQGEYNLMLEVEYAGIVEDFELGFSVKTGIWAGIKRFFGGMFWKWIKPKNSQKKDYS